MLIARASVPVVMPGLSHDDVPCPPREHGRIRRRQPRSECGSAMPLSIKKQLMASERERADVRERRREWIERRQPRMRLQPARLVFIDETAVNTKMTRLRGRSRRGQRLRASAPFGRWGTQTFIAALRCDG